MTAACRRRVLLNTTSRQLYKPNQEIKNHPRVQKQQSRQLPYPMIFSKYSLVLFSRALLYFVGKNNNRVNVIFVSVGFNCEYKVIQ